MANFTFAQARVQSLKFRAFQDGALQFLNYSNSGGYCLIQYDTGWEWSATNSEACAEFQYETKADALNAAKAAVG